MGDVFKVYGYSDSSNNKLWTVFCEQSTRGWD